MSKLEDRLKEIEVRAEAATAGPWRQSIWNAGRQVVGPMDEFIGELQYDSDGKYDGRFIARSRVDIPALIEVVRVLLDGLGDCTYRPLSTTGGVVGEHYPQCLKCSTLAKAETILCRGGEG